MTLAAQPDFFAGEEQATIQAAFEEFHRINPWVYEQLVMRSRRLLARGHRKVGIGMLFEILRWRHMMTTIDPQSPFKLNNNYRSRYARKIMRECPDLADFFELRALQSD